jgi:hypothetical protein
MVKTLHSVGYCYQEFQRNGLLSSAGQNSFLHEDGGKYHTARCLIPEDISILSFVLSHKIYPILLGYIEWVSLAVMLQYHIDQISV